MKLIERLVIVLFSLLLSQFPLFVEQYQIKLEAHISEAHRIVSQFEEISKRRGKSILEYIEKFVSSDDLDIREQGLFMERSIARYDRLLSFQKRIAAKNSTFQPILFPVSCDFTIAYETWSSYKIGFLLTQATALWAIFGALLGYVMIMFCHLRIKSRVKREELNTALPLS